MKKNIPGCCRFKKKIKFSLNVMSLEFLQFSFISGYTKKCLYQKKNICVFSFQLLNIMSLQHLKFVNECLPIHLVFRRPQDRVVEENSDYTFQNNSNEPAQVKVVWWGDTTFIIHSKHFAISGEWL